MKSLLKSRVRFGVIVAGILLVILIVHATEYRKFDNVGLGLIVGILAAVAFALSEQLGITKLTAGPLSVEITERAKKAGQAIPIDQRGAVATVPPCDFPGFRGDFSVLENCGGQIKRGCF
jgi:hypothetical protein